MRFFSRELPNGRIAPMPKNVPRFQYAGESNAVHPGPASSDVDLQFETMDVISVTELPPDDYQAYLGDWTAGRAVIQ
jgi:hypothetical protein